MKKASVERDAKTDELGRAVLERMEAHIARTALAGAASPQLPPSPAVPGAASPQPPSPAVPSTDELSRAILALMETRRARTALPDAASPQPPPSPAMPSAASPQPPPSPSVPSAASPQPPPWARKGAPPTEGQPASVGSPRTDLSGRVSPDAPPHMPMGIGGPNIEFRSLVGPRQHDGNFSINEAQSRASPEPDVEPKPPVPMLAGAAQWVGGLIILFLVAGISAYGSLLIASRDRTALVSPPGAPATSDVAGAPAAGKQREQSAAIPRLIVEDRRAYVNEPLLLGLSLDSASGGEFLLIKGLDAATRLSVGTLIGPNSWRVSEFGSR